MRAQAIVSRADVQATNLHAVRTGSNGGNA